MVVVVLLRGALVVDEGGRGGVLLLNAFSGV